MAPVGKSWSKAKAACPWPEHAGSRGGFDGHYGPPGHRRQCDKCIPADGDRRHRFAEVLPREGSWNDGCESCERDVGLREGSHAARRYQFVACGVAEAVVAVGAGSTYRDMALVAAGASRAAPGGPGRGAAVLAARVAGDGLGGGVRAGRVRGVQANGVALIRRETSIVDRGKLHHQMPGRWWGSGVQLAPGEGAISPRPAC
jgi:hypothetical protein